MSNLQELKSNGKAVGSREYFKDLDKSKVLDNNEYYKKLQKNIEKVLDEVNEDLKQNADVVAYVDRSEREKLLKVVKGINKVTKTSSSKANTIMSILNLSDSSTRPKSNASKSDIEKSAYILKNGGKSRTSEWERTSLVKKASSNDIKRIATEGTEAFKFLMEVFKGSSNKQREYFQDVNSFYKFKYSRDKLKGKNGQAICTTGYISKVLDNALANVPNGSSSSDKIENKVIAPIKQLSSTIMQHIENGIGTQYHVTYENRKNIIAAMKEIKAVMKEIAPNNSDIPTESEVKAKLLKLRRLEDFDNSVIDLDYPPLTHPIGMQLKWENGQNKLYIHVKVKFEGLTKEKHNAIIKKENGEYLEKDKEKLTRTTQIVEDEDNYFYDKNGQKVSEQKRKDIIFEGIKMWNGNYPRVFKNDDGIQQIQVICTTEEVSSGSAINIVIPDRTIDDISNVALEKGAYWGNSDMKSNLGKITMFAIYEGKEEPYTTDNYKHTAKHEFGHVLGLMDAYTDIKENDKRITTKSNDYNKNEYEDIQDEIENYGLKNIPIECDHTEYNIWHKCYYTDMVMNKSTGKITNNDIEMVIRAWVSKKEQYYRSILGHEKSDVLGR